MPDREYPPDFSLYDPPRRHGRTLLTLTASFGLVVFILGGLYYAHVALTNWKVLTSRRIAAPPIEVTLPTGQVLPLQPPARLPLPPPDPVAPPGPHLEAPPALPAVLLPDWTGRDRINVLLLGIDHREDEPLEGSRSDTIMLVSVDPASRSVVMVSLPRDLWVSIPGYGEQRINVAHSLGGPELLMRTVANNFGIRIQHFARIDFRGFEQVVDTLGGVFVDVERPIKDDEYPTDEYGVTRIYIPAGPQWMNGRTALQFARSRHSETDFGRARRQQRVLMAIRERAVQANMVFKAPEFLPLAQKTIATDFNALDLIKLAKLSTEIDRDRIVSVVIDADYASPYITADGWEVLIPNRPAIQATILQAFQRAAARASATQGPGASAPASSGSAANQQGAVRIEVLNGSNRNGLAGAAAAWLRQRGFEVTRVDSADRADYGETRVLARPGREGAAASLAAVLGLPGNAVQTLPGSASSPDVRLILGQNFQVPTR